MTQPQSKLEQMRALLRERAELAAKREMAILEAGDAARYNLPHGGVTNPTAHADKPYASPHTLSAATFELPEPTEDHLNQEIFGMKFNREQWQAILMGEALQSFCLIGAAGTGKTTTMRELVRRAMISVAPEGDINKLDKNAIALLSFTKRAVRNLAKAVKPIGATKYTHTIHKFLGYAPVEDEYFDDEGAVHTKFSFEPTYTKLNPLLECRLVIIEESSMCGYETLYRELFEACPNATFIFLGDINQLPPVMGSAVLGFKLATIPVVELTHVYRQALDSPIIAFQHRHTLKGISVSTAEMDRISASCTKERGLMFRPFKKPFQDEDGACDVIAQYMMQLYNDGAYDPDQDMWLCPFGKKFGTIGINKHFVDRLGQKRGAVVHEIIAGYEKYYFAVGDRILYEKMDYEIVDITPNKRYHGTKPMQASAQLSRYGFYRGHVDMKAFDTVEAVSVDDEWEHILAMADGDSDMTMKCSHHLILEDRETGARATVSDIKGYKATEFAYCTTVHKSQGSEWRRVWIILHRMHASMLSRELLYTAMTRAKERCEVLYSLAAQKGGRAHTINKALDKAAIAGVGWRAKAEAFKGKLERGAIEQFE